MDLFPGYDSNLPTQLWIAARYLQAISILSATVFINKNVKPYALFFGYLVVCSILIVSIFSRIFPECYIEGIRLTSFKIYSEYIITFILLISILFLIKKRPEFEKRMFFLLVFSIISTIISELAFTFYVSVYGFSNFVGHIFKIIEFYLIYKALIQTGLKNPLNSLFLKLKRSEESYKEAYDRASFYKDLFTHDIRNIIQSLNLSVEIIKKDSNAKENMINIIEDQISRATKLISNVQKLSEIETIKITLEKIEINKKLKNVIAYIYQSFPEKNLEINLDLFSNEILVLANDLIVDIFENILINAILYNEEKIIEITIKASEFKENKKHFMKLEFIDNSKGIKDTLKENVFQRGYNEAKGSVGMGLGLSLVKKILESYNGKIWIENRVEGDYSKGSNFIILLPMVII